MAIDIFRLNKAQGEAVTHGEGPMILVAGAGTGKTTVVTNRLAWLITEGKAKPEDILALTFTEKAAGEMEERVDQLLPLGYADLWIHTFHAYCQRVLQQHALDIGLPNDFKVFDATALWMLLREHINTFALDYYRPLSNPTKFVHAMIRHFGRCKDEGIYPEEYVKYAEELKLNTDQSGDLDALNQEVARIEELAASYLRYQELLLENNVLDFGDLINYCLKLFNKRSTILALFRQQFKYILVDEFQDTNWAQYQLVKLLAAPRNNIMVVGDDDQSIYKFRGASFSNILTFKKDYPKAQEIYLTENYRSGQKILDVAYDFIQLNNPDRLEVKLQSKDTTLSKQLRSMLDINGSVEVMKFQTSDDEIRGVIDQIVQLKEADKHFAWDDTAVLVRTNEQAQGLVRYFRSVGLPHVFLASKGLYSQEVVLYIVSYLKILDNYHESPAVYKILSTPVWGIVSEDIIELNHIAKKKSLSLWQALEIVGSETRFRESTVKGIAKFKKMIAKHTELAKRMAPSVLIYRLLQDSGFLDIITLEDTKFNREQMLYLNQFYKKVRTWEEEHLEQGVHEYIRALNLELESGEQGSLQQDVEEGPENVKIMTIHGAKGLEFKYVFIIGMVHLRFPTIERKDPIAIPDALIKDELPSGDAHLQEERRLMYVALTRAKEKVFLSYAQDYGGASKRKPSRFLGELGLNLEQERPTVSGDLILTSLPQDTKVRYKLPRKFSYSQLKAFETCPKQYYYAHIIKIPAAGRATFSFGKIIHAVLEQFFQVVRDKGSHQQVSLFADVQSESISTTIPKKDLSEKELVKLYESLWDEDWYFDAKNKQEYFNKGKRMLREFFANLPEAVPVPILLEQKFNLKLGDISLMGVIDRIDTILVDTIPSWHIIDYKTGTAPKDDKLSFAMKEQLLLYQLAAEEVFQKKASRLTLYYVDGNKQLSFIGTTKDIDKLNIAIAATVAAIKESDFKVKPGIWCRSCDYRFICPAAQLK